LIEGQTAFSAKACRAIELARRHTAMRLANVIRTKARARIENGDAASGAPQRQELFEETSRGDQPEPPICQPARVHQSHPRSEMAPHASINAEAGTRV
jgi:hypothetical protein